MSDNSSNQNHTYRWEWWIIFLNFSTSIYMLPALTLLIGMFGYFIYDMVKSSAVIGIIIFAVFSPFILLFVIFWFWFLLYPFGRLFFSYFTISPEGIEYRYWPTYAVRCYWGDVEKIGKFKSLGLIAYDVLYLKQAKPIGKPIMMTLRNKFGLKTQYLVPLTGIHGWRQGKLKTELQKYAPQLFEDNVSDKKEIPQSENAG